ncbi:SubName: Full=Related to kinesin light chain {ECO:0000313/EMBL:CCA76332.1}; Flags: Fragment [Serendipita indica DSM 11827]|nr:SubName: Full=Related to kinesin light chain {ECO:0000313/EMBL:CCA76332.1}; Flags: Fragment [Serendipita indica DSM 11827]
MYMKATNFILKDLQFHSSELENIQSLYVAASEKISSIYFCEEYKTTYERKRRRLSVPLHPAVIAGNRNCITNVLYADHESLVRFPDATSENYQVVLHYLNDYCDSAPGVVMEKWLIEDNLRATEELTIWNVTLPKALPPMSMYYIDRPEIHSLITRILLLDGRPKRQPRCILHGLGGAGKTQLATNWIQEYKSRFTWVIFVDASSQTQIEADLQLAIRSLGPEYSHTTWEDAMAYLDGKGKGWLLFVDNADSPNLNLDPYLPTSIHGTILVTTRNYECIGYAPDGAVPVGGLQECEAVNLLHIVANVKPTSNGESLEIVRELGMLALAITQAGTYIRNTQRLSGYLDTFRKHRRRLLRKHPDTGSYYKLSTYATFDLSFIQLPTKTQEFMKLCAFLYHSFIPITLFEQSTESGFCTHTILDDCPPPESDKVFISKLQEILGTTWDEIAFQEIVDSALRASFIQVSTDGLFYTISPLLQMYIKDSLDGEEPQRYLRTVVQLLLGAIRPSEGSNIKLRQLLCHTNNIPWSLKSENVAHTLAFHELYNALCDWKVCREMLESALSQLHQTEGRSHESSIWLMGKIAIATWNCGRLEEAEKLQRDVLSLRRETNGSQHPGTLSAMSDLAIMLRDVGKLDEAEKVQREVLDMLIGLHGRRYQDTISAMGNLAITLRTRGQMDSAGEMQREVLALRHELLGQYHTDTLSAMSDLAMTLRTRGQLETAEAMQKVVVNLRLTVLERHHPGTISAMDDLAATLRIRGQFDEAKTMQREVLALRLDLLGQQHPDTLSAMSNLAIILRTSNQLDEAETMQREVLALWRQLLGQHHPDTISAMGNLAVTLQRRDLLNEAEAMQREVLTLRLKVLGRHHPDTLSTMSDLAIILRTSNRLDEAETMQREVLALRRELLDQHHPDTISVIGDLATTLRARGKVEEAGKMQREVFRLRLDLLGRQPPDVISTVDNLAVSFVRQSHSNQIDKVIQPETVWDEGSAEVKNEKDPAPFMSNSTPSLVDNPTPDSADLNSAKTGKKRKRDIDDGNTRRSVSILKTVSSRIAKILGITE